MESEAKPSRSSAKDCRNCSRRRIRCDRAFPHCVKCLNKRISCPGYGVQIRWTNAIASRGRFKGLSVPDTSPKAPSPGREVFAAVFPEQSPRSHPECTSGRSSTLVSLPEAVLSKLLNYYSTNIAPLNVWIDSEQNGYKTLVIPLARTQPVLRLAILGISASHAPHDSVSDANFARSACQRAVLMITERVAKLASMHADKSDSQEDDNGDGTIEAVLAAMLILSNQSLIKSDVTLAQFHLQAARVLIKTLTFNRTRNDDLFAFLKNQVATYDVLACTTIFSLDHIQHAVLPEFERGPILFGHYLKIIHDITMRSVQTHENDPGGDHVAIAELEDEFELARGSTLLAAGPLARLQITPSEHDFIRLVQTFHHAGILYACKRSGDTDASEVENYHSNKLFKALKQFEDIDACLARLSWPIFIGGICSCRDEERMRFVKTLCQMLCERTRFEYYAGVCAFLKELWASEHQDWIRLAQQREDEGVPIMAF